MLIALRADRSRSHRRGSPLQRRGPETGSAGATSSRRARACSSGVAHRGSVCALGDAQHRRGERVERFLRLRLRGLDHQRLWHDEREVHRGRVETLVEQRLRKVEGGRALLLLLRGAENELVHRRPVVRDVVCRPKERQEVVGGKDRVASRFHQALLTERLHIGVCTNQDAKVPETLLDRADGLPQPGGRTVLARRVVVIRAVGLAHDPRLRQERTEMRFHAERTRARPARAVRRRERLVDVDVDAVEAEIAGTRDAEKRVHVGAIAVHERAGGMHRVADLTHALLEETERVRVREHEASDVGSERALERLEVDVPARVALHGRDLVAAHRRGRGVCPVRRVRNDDPPALLGLAALRVVCLEHKQRGELGLRAGLRLQRDEVHAGDLHEHLLELVREREDALRRAVRLTRMHVGKEPGDAVVHLRVVLHRAGAERIHPGIDRIVQLREVRVVAHDLRLRQLRQPQRCRSPERVRDLGGLVRPHVPAAPSRSRELEEQWLERGHRCLRSDIGDDLGAQRHRAATFSPARARSATASTRASASSSVVSSVHCTITSSRPSRRPSTKCDAVASTWTAADQRVRNPTAHLVAA